MNDRPDAKRVLVIDDDQQFAEVLADCLQLDNYAVEVCLHGEKALERSRAFRPDLIVLDIRMPERSGLCVLDQLATDPATARTPVLMCSAVSPYETGVWQELLAERGVPVLFKPFEVQDLLTQVRQLVEGPRRTLPPAVPATGRDAAPDGPR